MGKFNYFIDTTHHILRRKGEKEKRRKGEKEKGRKGEKEKRRKGEEEKRGN